MTRPKGVLSIVRSLGLGPLPVEINSLGPNSMMSRIKDDDFLGPFYLAICLPLPDVTALLCPFVRPSVRLSVRESPNDAFNGDAMNNDEKVASNLLHGTYF